MRIKNLLATLVLACILAATGTVVAQEASGAAGEKSMADQRPFLDPELKSNIQARGTATSLVYLREQADLTPAFDMGWEERGWFVYNTLKEVADRSQAALKAELDSMGGDYHAFWIDNVIAVRNTDAQILSMLASRPDVAAVIQEPVGFIPEPPANLVNDDNQIQAVVDSLVHINVPDVWALGYTGQDVDVGIIDSGTRYTHDALVNQYRGNLGGGSFDHNYNWYDVGGTTEPVWPNPHGSHVTGTAVGDDGGDNQIGAAPGAEWVSCLGCTSTSCPGTNLLACGEFMAAPTDLSGNNPDPSQRVHVVNNSWGDCGQTYDGWYQGVVDGWIAAGVVPIISNGNAGNCGYSSPPGPNTVGNPARYGSVLGIGSSGNSNGQYATHSNWGPTDNPNDGTNPALPDPMGYPDLKPNVIAPGVNICSALSSAGDSGYTCGYTGTSMSAPAATGVIALMISAAPSLAGDFATLGTVLMQTATPIDYDSGVGGEGPGNVPNYATGWGEIDALAAVQGALNAAGPRGTLTGTVTDIDSGNPIEGVTVSTEDFESPPNPITTTTDAAGSYSLSLPETGTGESYDIEFSRNGYQTALVTGLTITDDETITLDQQLQAVAGETVSGQVTDANFPGTGIEGAEALFTDGDGFTYGPATTDATGNYSIDLPPGLTYDATVSAAGYETFNGSIGTVSGPTTADFTLNAGIIELPATASLALDRGTQGSTTITVNNTGTADAEVNLGFIGTGAVLFEDFEGTFPPAGWSLVDNSTPAPCPWTTTDQTSVIGWSGTARAATADADDCGSGQANDTSLVTPSVDLSAATTATLNFDMALRSGFESTNLALEVSTNGGSSWNTVDTWVDEDVAYPGADFAAQTYDLSAYAGESDVQVRWRYQAGWSWWVIVDNVEVTSDAAGIPWASASPMTVNVPQGGSTDVDLLVDATELAAGVYNIDLNVLSGSAYDVTPTDFEVTVNAVPEIILPETVDITVTYPNTTSQAFDIENVGGASGDVTLDFIPAGINEDFEGTFPPAGWTVVDNSSPACPWTTTDVTTPIGWPAGGSRGAVADADACGSGIQADTALISPTIDLTSASGSVFLDFDFAYRSGFADSTVTLLVSGDGGDTWDVIDSWTDGEDVAYPSTPYEPQSYDLAAYAGQSEVLIQWHYEAGWSYWTIVDNVQIQPPPINWATANPSLVTVPATSTVPGNIDIDSSVLPGPGVYQASMNGSVDSPFAIDSTLVTLTVEPGADLAGINGTVESLGYCGSNPFNAAGAGIEIVGVNNTYTTTADENGFYEIFIPSDETPVDITASAPNHLDGTQTGVALTPADSITVDFSLDLDEPCAGTTPTTLSSTLEIGNTDSQPLTIENIDGAGQLDWTLEEAQPQVVLTDEAPSGAAPTGAAPAGTTADLVSQIGGGFPMGPVISGGFDCTNAPGLVINDDGSIENGYSGNPASVSTVSVVEAYSASGGQFLNTVCFALISLGPDSANVEVVVYDDDGAGGAPGTEVAAVPTTATNIPVIAPGDPIPVVWHTADMSGEGISVDGTVYIGIRWTPTDPNVFTAADENGPGGAAGYFRTDGGAWGPTGDSFPDYSALMVRPQFVSPSGCASPGDVSWLSVTPTTGSTAPGGTSNVTVDFDSTGLSPGTYEASICVNSNDPQNPIVAVPVTLEATAPASFASVTGTVQSLGYCSSDPFAAAGASVDIVSSAQTYNLTADAAGAYELFLDSAEGPVDVTATAPNHDTQTVTGIALTAGANEVVDFDLILQEACASITPASLSDSISDGGTYDYTVTVGNADGAVNLDWTLDIDEPALAYQQGLPNAGLFVPAANGWDRASGQSTVERDGRSPSAEAGVQGGPIGVDFTEGFDDITTLPGAGWSLQNLSDPLGTTDWFQGSDATFPSHEGAATAYIGANFNNTTGGTGTISNWLLTPEVELNEGTTLSFWTRVPAGTSWADRLEVRMSTAGASTDVGTGATDVGDFTELMLTVNEDLTVPGYPEAWTQYTVEVTGLPAGATGRFAFRYFVTNGGPDGANSNYIGIDTVAVTQPAACVNPIGSSWLSVDSTAGTVAAGDTQDLTVTVDGSQLSNGTNEAFLCITTDDANATDWVVPVTIDSITDAIFGDRFEQ